MKIKAFSKLKNIDWESFSLYPLVKKVELFTIAKGSLFDVLYAQQFSREVLDRLYVLTNRIREIAKSEQGKEWLSTLLRNRRAMLYFIQPSTRTFLSFSSACNILGLVTSNVRSAETSSEVKGESFGDTIRTFSSYFDLIVMRHDQGGAAEWATFILNKSSRPIPLINAGSGKDQHPTQALLDIYTLRRSFEDQGGIENKIIMMTGDLKRGRTVRSLSYLLSNFPGVKIIYSSPPLFKMEQDIKDFLNEKKINFFETSEFNSMLPQVDAVYMTRLQDEYQYDDLGNNPIYEVENYCLTQESLALMKPTAIIMHPMPRREEIHPSVDDDRRALYWRQMRNGMWTRCALIASIFGLEDMINDYNG